MKKQLIKREGIVNSVLRMATLVFIVSLIVLAVESSSQNMVVTVTVEPTRVIIVDKNFTIQKIISNTGADVRPIVYLNSEDGLEVPYTESIFNQYMFLKNTLNFSQPGIIYDRDERTPIALLKLVFRTAKKILGIPF